MRRVVQWALLPTLLLVFNAHDATYAQVVTNITPTTTAPLNLGTNVHTVGTTTQITGGTRPGSGTNLFHSFDAFSLGTGDTAHFLNDMQLPTTNIFGRVIGGEVSSIDGTLRTNNPLNAADPMNFGSANLWLVNPSGLFLGPNARIEVGGSVSLSTANYLRFEGAAALFDMLSSSASLGPLSVAPVAAFGFTSPQPVAILVQGSTLAVPIGQSLSIVGGDLEIRGGQVSAPSGQVHIVGVGSEGEVIASAAGGAPHFNVDSFSNLGRVEITETANVNADGTPSGTVTIRAKTLLVDQAGVTAMNLGPTDGAPLAIDIHAAESLVVDRGSQVGAISLASGGAGDVRIIAGNLEVRDSSLVGSLALPSATTDVGNVAVSAESIRIIGGGGGETAILADNLGSGKAGDISITTGSLEVDGNEGVAFISAGAVHGTAGQIQLNTQSVLLKAIDPFGAFVLADSLADGDAGSVLVSTGRLELRGDHGDVLITADKDGSGNAGTIEINAQDVFMRGGLGSLADISASHFGESGDAGQVRVNARTIEIRGMATIATSRSVERGSLGTGISGSIQLTADRILIDGEGLQEETSLGGVYSRNLNNVDTRPAGGIEITSQELTLSNKARISTFTNTDVRAGDIVVQTNTLDVTHGGILDSTTFGSGDAGTINITADRVTLSGPNPIQLLGFPTPSGEFQFSEVAATGLFAVSGILPGRAGAIQISSGELVIRDGAQISTQTFGLGRGGDISVDAGTVHMTGADFEHGVPSAILTDASVFPGFEVFARGRGGNINVQAARMTMDSGATVSASSSGTGNAGTITINAGSEFLSTNSSVTTEATQASGGNITLLASDMIRLQNSQISASVSGETQTAGGNITIDPQFVILQNSQILARANVGSGGTINITAGVFVADPVSLVDASAKSGNSGTVSIQSPVQNVGGQLTPLSQQFSSAAALLTQRCAADSAGQFSSFVQTGRDGVPQVPGALSPSPLSFLETLTSGSLGSPGLNLAAARLGLDSVSFDVSTRFHSACRS